MALRACWAIPWLLLGALEGPLGTLDRPKRADTIWPFSSEGSHWPLCCRFLLQKMVLEVLSSLGLLLGVPGRLLRPIWVPGGAMLSSSSSICSYMSYDAFVLLRLLIVLLLIALPLCLRHALPLLLLLPKRLINSSHILASAFSLAAMRFCRSRVSSSSFSLSLKFLILSWENNCS